MVNRNTSAEFFERAGLKTGTKVIYDSKGIILRSSHATTDDIAETVNKRYLTGAQSAALNSVSGVNTGDNAVNSLYASIVGIPIGGSTGQVLSKVDNTDYNIQWVAVVGGGGSGDALTTNPLSQFAATTKAQLDGVISDGNIMYIGDSPTVHTHTISDITDFGIYSTDIHSNITALDLVSGTNTGDQDLSGLLVKASNLSDVTNVSTARTNLGLGSLAIQSGTFSGTSSGTNTGDQISIVGITGIKSEFNTAVTDGNFMFIGDAPTTHTHVIADITDFGVYSTDIHSNIIALNAVSGVNTGDQDLSSLLVKTNNLSDLTNVITARSNLGLGSLATQSGTFSGTSSGTNTGDQTSIVGISGTKVQFNTAVSDGDIFFMDDITGTPDGSKFLKDDLSWSTIPSSGSKSVNNISTNTSAGNISGTDYYYLCDGDITLTLPTAVGNTNKYTVKNIGTGVIIITTVLSQLIDSWNQVTISFQNNSLDIISDGTNYRIT